MKLEGLFFFPFFITCARTGEEPCAGAREDVPYRPISLGGITQHFFKDGEQYIEFHRELTQGNQKSTVSSFGVHQYIARHSGRYTCKYCGHTLSSASAGSCNKSPNRKHEYI